MSQEEDTERIRKFMMRLHDVSGELQREFKVTDLDKIMVMWSLSSMVLKEYLMKNVVGYREMTVELRRQLEELRKEFIEYKLSQGKKKKNEKRT